MANETVVDVNEIAKRAAEAAIENYRKSTARPESATAVSESVIKPMTIQEAAKKGDYKARVVELLKDITPDQFRTRDIMQETIGAVAGTAAVPTIWAADVGRNQVYPASAFWDNPYINWHNDVKGAAGGTVMLLRVNPMTAGTAGCAEPVSTAPTIVAKTAELAEWQCSFYLCRNDMEDMVPDTVTALNDTLSSCLAAVVDNHFVAAIRSCGLGSIITSADGTKQIGPNDISKAIGTLRTGTNEPVWGLMHPQIEAQLMGSAQFLNAATFGDRSVITGGHITRFLGVDFSVVPCGSLWNSVGTFFYTFLAARGIIAGVRKRDPDIQTQYLVQTQRKYVYASTRFAGTVVNASGIIMVLANAGI